MTVTQMSFLAADTPTLLIEVRHPRPVGQGRISHGKTGRGYHSNAKLLNPWRKAVRAAALAAAAGAEPITGPVILDITVTVPKPKSAPKRRVTWPVTRSSGDWDHLGRAVSDALAADKRNGLLGVIVDDSQVVEGTVRKVYPDEGVFALSEPGAVIQLWALP